MRESWVVQDWLEEGLESGRQEEARRFLTILLEDKFGALPDWATARLATAEPQQIEAWGRRILRAHTLEEAISLSLP